MNLDWATRPDLAAAVIAGWLTGAVVGLVLLGVVVIGLSREAAWWERFPGLRVSLPVFGIIAANAMLFGWTLVGVALGFLYVALSMPAYSIAVVATGVLLGAAYWVGRADARGAERGIVWTSLVAATALFAGAVPVIAEL